MSVRELSAQLNVSEGTAYKAVKDAERRGLVVIKPKAGTVRVASEQPVIEKAVTARELTRVLGLGVSAGRGALDREVRRVVICDGSETDLLRQLEGIDPKLCLCLCGERPEMQSLVVEQGANLLLTGGAKASWIHINAVERKGQYILSTAHSSYALVRQLDAELAGQGDLVGSTPVADWMQTPDYLYYNDIAADWQRLYSESTLLKQYPIVDDELGIYGGLDIWQAAASVPSQRLSSMVAESEDFSRVSLQDDIQDVARRFVMNGEELAAVMDDKRMVGTISAIDLLRYYMHADMGSREFDASTYLVRDTTVSGEDMLVYRLRIPTSELMTSAQIELVLLLSAAASHMRELGCKSYQFQSGTFFAPVSITNIEGLRLTSRLNHTGGQTYMIEMEINDDSVSYAKAMITAMGTIE